MESLSIRPLFTAAALLVLATGLPRSTLAQGGGQPSTPAQRAAAAHLAPGDQVVLKMWLDELVTETSVVNERSELILPKLGVVSVGGLTIRTLEDSLRARYAQFLRNPAVDVTVLRRVIVQGAVARPDVYLVDVTMTLRDVIARAGGVTEAGNKRKVRIIRDGREIPMRGWERDQTIASDLRSGDQVVVGHRSWLVRNFFPAVSAAAVVWSIILSVRQM